MKRRGILICWLTLLICLPSLLHGQDRAAESTLSSDEVAVPEGFPEDLLDPPFDRFVDLQFARQALSDTNASQLTDAALQAAEGERVLGRPRKGFTADQLLTVAVRLAADDRDKETLDRIARAAAALGKPALKLRVDAAQKLADTPRAPNLGPRVPLQRISPEAILVFRAIAQEVKLCSSIGDHKGLRQLQVTVGQLTELHARQREFLIQAINKSIADTQQGGNADTLAKLAGVGRGNYLYSVRNTTPVHQIVNIAGLGIYDLASDQSKTFFSMYQPRVIFVRKQISNPFGSQWLTFSRAAGVYRITWDPLNGIRLLASGQ